MVCWLLVVAGCVLFVRCWLCWSLLVLLIMLCVGVCCSLFAVCCVLFVVCGVGVGVVVRCVVFAVGY